MHVYKNGCCRPERLSSETTTWLGKDSEVEREREWEEKIKDRRERKKENDSKKYHLTQHWLQHYITCTHGHQHIQHQCPDLFLVKKSFLPVSIVIIYSHSCWWKVLWGFVVHKTFLKLHSKTAFSSATEGDEDSLFFFFFFFFFFEKTAHGSISFWEPRNTKLILETLFTPIFKTKSSQ